MAAYMIQGQLFRAISKYCSRSAELRWTNHLRYISNDSTEKTRPKRPLSSFFAYVQDIRKDLNEKYPDKKLGEKSKIASDMYKGLNVEEKEKYINAYAKQLIEYRQKIEQWQNSLSSQEKKDLGEKSKQVRQKRMERKLVKAVKKTGKPKKPASTFVLFYQDQLKLKSTELMTMTPPEKKKALLKLTKESAELWKNMDEKEKEVYRNKFNKLYQDYKVQLDLWTKDMLAKGNTYLVSKKANTDIEMPRKSLTKGTKQATSVMVKSLKAAKSSGKATEKDTDKTSTEKASKKENSSDIEKGSAEE